MAVTKSILGMNARNFLYIRQYNSIEEKRRADDKLATKEVLIKNRLPVPKLLAGFYHADDITHFHWKLPKDGFVIKPARGYGGGGILAITSWDGKNAVASSGETYTKEQLQSHLYDIFDGAYSLNFLPDKAFIEGLVIPSSFFTKLDALGVPDIRVIVFNKVPVMAMLRFPTKESKGKANVHLGAIAIGIDMRSGITTHAIYKGKRITYFPETKRKVSDIQIPSWRELLLLASRAAIASKLGYVGVDIVLDELRGPLLLEINARPGLAIQNANLASLRTRLERIEDMHIETAERGVEVAQSLFSVSSAFDRVKISSPKILTVIQPLMIFGNLTEGNVQSVRKKEVFAKLDTGAYRTSIDKNLAKELQLPINNQKVHVTSASGKTFRPTVHVTFELAGKKIKTIASVVDREHLKFPIIVGRLNLQGFLIQPDYGKFPDGDQLIDDTIE